MLKSKINKTNNESWLAYFKRQDEQRDFPLVVENTNLFVNKHLLAASSLFFKKALFGELKEANQNFMALPDKKVEDIATLLSCALYYLPGRERCEVSIDNFATVYRLADEYIIEELVELCLQLLDERITRPVTMSGDEIVRWFEKGAFSAIFTYDRFALFRPKVIELLKCVRLKVWKPFVNVIPVEELVEMMDEKEDRYLLSCVTCDQCCFPVQTDTVKHCATCTENFMLQQ